MEKDFLKIAHIHLEQATFRVHVDNSSLFDIEAANNDDSKPEFVLWIGRSADPEQTKQSLLVNVSEGYDLHELAEWVNSLNKQQ